MNLIQCKKCKKCFNYQAEYQRHLEIRTDCAQNDSLPVLPIEVNKAEIHECERCGQIFTYKQNLTRHFENKEGKCFNNKIKKKRNNRTKTVNKITNNINNKVINNYNNIQPIINNIQFVKNVPRNSNWCIAYPKNEEGAIVFNYEDNKFMRKLTVEVIDDKFTNMMMLMEPLIEEIYNEDEKFPNLNDLQRKNLARFKHMFGGDISDASKEIFESVRTLAFKNKAIPMTSWKEQGFKGNHLSLKF